MAKFAKIYNLGTWDALANEALKGQIDNFGSLLVLGTDITGSFVVSFGFIQVGPEKTEKRIGESIRSQQIQGRSSSRRRKQESE